MSETRADQILEAFVAFHKANPEIWGLFQKFTFMAMQSRDFYSSDAICHRIRWHTDVETQGGGVKLNNNFTAYYARLFETKYPEHFGFFRNRARTSTYRDASENDEQVFIGPSAGKEPTMDALLRSLLEEDEFNPGESPKPKSAADKQWPAYGEPDL